MIYDILVFVILISFYFLQDRKNYCCFVSVLLLLFAGLRANYIGPDTPQYEYIYEQIASHNFQYSMEVRNSSEVTSEIGYFYLQYFISRFFSSYNVFKFICSAISVLPAFYVIYRFSRNIVISFCVFFTLPIFVTVSMSMMRQGCAFGICMIAYIFFIKHRFLPFFAFVLLAFLFHESALFFLPVYLIHFMKLKKSYLIYVIFVLVLFYINSRFIFNFLTQYSRIHYTEGAAGGYGMLFFMLLLLLSSFCFIDKKEIGNDEIKSQVYLLVYTIILWIIGLNLAAVFRLAAYTEFFICLYVSNVFLHIKDSIIRNSLFLASIIICVCVMHSVVFRKMEFFSFYPYYFIWE